MSSIESLTFENGKMVLYVDFGTKSEPDKSKIFYNSREKREEELAGLANAIIAEAIGNASKPKKISHEKSDEPIKGYTLNYENNDFRINKYVFSGYHSNYGVETNIWQKDKKVAMHAEIMVPPYERGYVLSSLGLTIGNQGEPYDFMPRGNIPDEKAWDLHKQFLKNTICSALQLKPQEIAKKI
jgi:hypothetical protein